MFRRSHPLLVVVGFFAIWEVLGRIFHAPNFVLPLPSAIFAELWHNMGWYGVHVAYTAWECLLGFALAVVVGSLAAIGIVYSKFLETTLYTFLVSLNSIPKIALAPIFIIWMGSNLSSKVAISMLIAVFSIVIDTVLGLRSVDADTLSMARSMRATPMQILLKIRLPAALPYFFAGMKVAISLALVGAIAGEFVASQAGLGYVILTAQGMFQITRVFAAVVLLGVMGSIFFYLLVLGERFAIPWHVTQRSDGSGSNH